MLMKKVWECESNFYKTKDIKSRLVYGNINKNADYTLAIPIYGLGRYLEETLINISELDTYGLCVQIIVSDNKPNGEIKKVINLLDKYGFQNIAYYLSDAPLGQLGNFNRCIELTQTEYLGMLHDDDLLVNNYFQIVNDLLPKLRSSPNIGLIQGGRIAFTHDIEIGRTQVVRLYKVTKPMITVAGYSMGEIPSCGMIINRRAAMEAGGFNDDYPSSGDAFLVLQMMEKGYSFYKSKDNFGYYRIGDNISLKLDICKGFIQQDYAFLESWASSGGIQSIYCRYFMNYFYSRNIDNKVNTFGKFNSDITVENLDFMNSYKKYTKYCIKNIIHSISSKLVGLYKLLNTKTIDLE